MRWSLFPAIGCYVRVWRSRMVVAGVRVEVRARFKIAAESQKTDINKQEQEKKVNKWRGF